MSDVAAGPPASQADLERLSAEIAGRSHVLHDELLNELTQQLQELQRAMAWAVHTEIEHSIRVHRSELRILRQTLASHTSLLVAVTADTEPPARQFRPGFALALLLAVGVAAVLLVAAITVTVTG